MSFSIVEKQTDFPVFLACPSDVRHERKLFNAVLNNVNKQHGYRYGVRYVPKGCATARLGVDRPQEIINEEVRVSLIFTCIFWNKWGTPTGRCSCGTEEEFFVALTESMQAGDRKHPELWVYFRITDQNATKINSEIKQFRAELDHSRLLLYSTYSNVEEWSGLFRDHLIKYLMQERFGSLKRSSSKSKQYLSFNKATSLNSIPTFNHFIGQWKASRRLWLEEVRRLHFEQFSGHDYPPMESPLELFYLGKKLKRTANLTQAEAIFSSIAFHSRYYWDISFKALAYTALSNIYLDRLDLDTSMWYFDRCCEFSLTNSTEKIRQEFYYEVSQLALRLRKFDHANRFARLHKESVSLPSFNHKSVENKLLRLKIESKCNPFLMDVDKLKDTINISESIDCPTCVGEAYWLNGKITAVKMIYDTAKKSFEKAARSFLRAGDLTRTMHSYLDIAFLDLECGDFEGAIKRMQAIRDFLKVKNHPEISRKLRHLNGVVEFARGQFTSAIASCEALKSEFEAEDDLEGVKLMSVCLAKLYIKKKERKYFEKALNPSRMALSLERQDVIRLNEPSYLRLLGNVYWALKDYPSAENTFRKSISLANKMSQTLEKGISKYTLGWMLAVLKKNTEALRELHEAKSLFGESGVSGYSGQISELIKRIELSEIYGKPKSPWE